jgi:hypothetical protein
MPLDKLLSVSSLRGHVACDTVVIQSLSPFTDANSQSTSRDILCLLSNSKVHCCVKWVDAWKEQRLNSECRDGNCKCSEKVYIGGKARRKETTRMTKT